jgi:PST family polysaccharide transporter
MIPQDSKKRLVSNIISLGMIQGITYLLPLLTFPYLIKILGANKFGLIAFSNAVIAYLGLVIEYGFNLSATQDIALNRNSNKKLSILFSGVILAKSLLFLCCSVLLILSIFLFDVIRNESLIYIVSLGVLFGQVLFPVWLFQGMESMRILSLLTILSKIFFTLLIFIFIKKQEDYWIVPLLNAISSIFIGIIAFAVGFRSFKLTFYIVGWNRLILHLKSGWHIFVSRIFVNFYSTTNTIILGIFTNNVVVANYAIAEKIIQATEGLFAPINQGIFPYLSIMYSNSKQRFYSMIKKVNALLVVFSFLLFVLINIYSLHLIDLIINEKKYLNEILLVLSILSISILTAPFGTTFTNIMIILDQNKTVLNIVRRTAFLNFALIIPLIYFWGPIGMAMCWVICQILHVYWYKTSFNKLRNVNY